MVYLLFAAAYFIGSIPTSIILVRLIKGVDIRDYGSGNAGGTNVSRVLGWKWGVLVIVADLLKGWISTALFPRMTEFSFSDPMLLPLLLGLTAILGHVFPLFAGFRGGKGVATAGGVALALSAPSMGITLLVFAVILFTSRYMFMASISGGVVYALLQYTLFPGSPSQKVFAITVVLLLFYLHRGNIQRFRQGNENRLGQRVKIEEKREES